MFPVQNLKIFDEKELEVNTNKQTNKQTTNISVSLVSDVWAGGD